MWNIASLILLGLTFASAHVELLTDRPIIGILSIPDQLSTNSFFHSSYVEWLSQGGARVVPVLYDLPSDKLEHLLSSINGVLFTGGSINLDFNSTFVKTAQTIVKHALSSKDHFPIWATCLGFQMISGIIANDFSVIESGFDSERLPLHLEFTELAQKSKLLSRATSEVINNLRTMNITANFHHDGVSSNQFSLNSRLDEFFNVISINKDRKGREFVSTIEAKRFPVFATQWHPEIPQFIWHRYPNPWEVIPREPECYSAMQYFANFFVLETRRNSRKFVSLDEEKSSLIYNYFAKDFEGTRSYVFPKYSRDM
jgi:gamma-glutamyl hydrolase